MAHTSFPMNCELVTLLYTQKFRKISNNYLKYPEVYDIIIAIPQYTQSSLIRIGSVLVMPIGWYLQSKNNGMKTILSTTGITKYFLLGHWIHDVVKLPSIANRLNVKKQVIEVK